MRIRRVIQKPIQHQSNGIDLAGDLNAAISANVNEPQAQTHLRTRSSNRIVQRGGQTQITSDHAANDEPGQHMEVEE
jgi:hypothetical protein